MGYIVRRSEGDNEWAEKDVASNRFVDLSVVLGGTVHIYIKSGEEEVVVNYDEANIAEGNIIRKASIKEEALDTINFELFEAANNGTLETTYKLYTTKGVEVGISTITLNSDNKTGVIKLANPVELINSYVLKGSNGIEVEVVAPDYYSTKDFVDKYTYTGNDLGANYSSSKTTFKLWAPNATQAKVMFYKTGADNTNDFDKEVLMTQGDKGVWTAEVTGDIKNTYYMYSVVNSEGEVLASDPYAKSAGVNGLKSMVVDLASTNPAGWNSDKNVTKKSITDASIYELHVRDFSIHEDSGITNKGKYLAFTEEGTKTSKGNISGIDYLEDLGINYVHILPTYDYATVDENQCAGYNWGYDPQNYNVPEGSYSTTPSDGNTRVNEYKQMVQALHKKDIGVIVDVVYNHVYDMEQFSINKITPGYFSRPNSNGSGCGNDTATERAMVKKYIVDSVKYWADEYHIDGFRFDLMGLIDVETMKEVRKELNKINPEIIIYGEGWTMDTTTVQDVTLATQDSANDLEGIAFFNDSIRDAIKGSSQEGNETSIGFVNGGATTDSVSTITKSFTGLTDWTNNPSQVINYASCHDNYTLWDKLCQANAEDSEEDRIQMNKMSAAIVYTSQGVPFIMQGEELLRSKKNEDGTYNGNSYNATDYVNAIDYNAVSEHKDVYDYYKGLIEFRKNHSSLRIDNFEDVVDNCKELEDLDENVVGYKISKCNKEVANSIIVVYNPNEEDTEISLPSGKWKLCINEDKAGTDVIETFKKTVTVKAKSCYVLVKGATTIAGADTESATKKKVVDPKEILAARQSMNETILFIVLCIITILIVTAGLLIYKQVYYGKLQEQTKYNLDDSVSDESDFVYEEQDSDIKKDIEVYNGNDIDNTIQYASSLSDLLQISDFKFDEEPQEYNENPQEF